MVISTVRTKPKAKGQRGKSIEEIVSYALGHRIRIEVLTLLNERVYCVEELAEKVGEPTNKVAHHVNELADGGAIELAKA
jgi:predicted transcriptional regulator